MAAKKAAKKAVKKSGKKPGKKSGKKSGKTTTKRAVKKPTKKGAKKKVTKTKTKPAAKKASKKKTAGAKGGTKKSAKRKAAPKKPMTPSQQKAYIAEIKSIVRKRVTPMKSFLVGDTVVEPSLGVSHIEGIRRQTIDGKCEDYFIFSSGTARVYVPMSQIEGRGVRRPMTREEIRRIFTQMKVPVSPTRGDARLQYLAYREIMKSGDPTKIARLLRELFTLDKMDELKGKEKEIMEQAKKFLIDEISFIRDDPKAKVLEDIQEALEQMYKRKVTKDREARSKRKAQSS
jgi:CarD family transcriptional regulator, regulator of rRNA transcription